MTNSTLLQACTQTAKLLQEAISNMPPKPQFTCANCHEYNRPDKILVDRHQYEQMQTLIAQIVNILTDNGISDTSKTTCIYARVNRYLRGEEL